MWLVYRELCIYQRYINLVLILLYGFIFLAFVQSNKLGVVCMFITGQQVAKFPCNTPLNWCLVNMLDNALHLVSGRGSPIVLFFILKACRVYNESEIVGPLMCGFIVKRVSGLSEISVPHNMGIHCRKWKTNILPTLIGTTTSGTPIVRY